MKILECYGLPTSTTKKCESRSRIEKSHTIPFFGTERTFGITVENWHGQACAFGSVAHRKIHTYCTVKDGTVRSNRYRHVLNPVACKYVNESCIWISCLYRHCQTFFTVINQHTYIKTAHRSFNPTNLFLVPNQSDTGLFFPQGRAWPTPVILLGTSTTGTCTVLRANVRACRFSPTSNANRLDVTPLWVRNFFHQRPKQKNIRRT